jgi:hypothetical protein
MKELIPILWRLNSITGKPDVIIKTAMQLGSLSSKVNQTR